MSRSESYLRIIDRQFRSAENTMYLAEYIKRNFKKLVDRMATQLYSSDDGYCTSLLSHSTDEITRFHESIAKSLSYIRDNINKYVLQFSINGMVHQILTADQTTTSRYPNTFMTGASRTGPTDTINLFDEISRVNKAFIQNIQLILRDMIKVKDNEPSESYQMQMFMADSMYPPGWEHLNDEGPLHEHKEYRSKIVLSEGGPKRIKEKMGGNACARENTLLTGDAREYVRSALLSNAVGGDPVDEERRIMRYEKIPYWQITHQTLSNVERNRDVEVGSSVRESESQVRTWKAYDDRNRPISRTFSRSKCCWL